MWKKLKNNNKKGFTLVELIVVLVILAILAALLIPALTGYIDKAKEKDVIAKTRQIVMAAQTLADEEYAKLATAGAVTFENTATATPKPAGEVTVQGTDHNTVEGLSEVDGIELTVNLTIADTDANGKLVSVVYWDSGANKRCTYSATDGTYVVVTATSLN